LGTSINFDVSMIVSSVLQCTSLKLFKVYCESQENHSADFHFIYVQEGVKSELRTYEKTIEIGYDHHESKMKLFQDTKGCAELLRLFKNCVLFTKIELKHVMLTPDTVIEIGNNNRTTLHTFYYTGVMEELMDDGTFALCPSDIYIIEGCSEIQKKCPLTSKKLGGEIQINGRMLQSWL